MKTKKESGDEDRQRLQNIVDKSKVDFSSSPLVPPKKSENEEERFQGLKCVSKNGDVFLDKKGRVYSLELSKFSGKRVLIAH